MRAGGPSDHRRFAPRDRRRSRDDAAPSQKVATAVLANFKQIVKDKPVRIHPIVSPLVDPAVPEKMNVRPVGAAEGKTERNIGGFGGKQKCIDNSGGERSAGRPAVETPRR